MLCHPYDTPTFETKCLVSNEGWLKRLLQLYRWIIQPYLSLLWLQLATHFVIFHTYDTPTEALHLVSNEGQIKRLLLQYKQLI